MKALIRIEDIVRHILDKSVIDAEVQYDNNSLTLVFDDGSVVEIVVDSIHAEVPDFDS